MVCVSRRAHADAGVAVGAVERWADALESWAEVDALLVLGVHQDESLPGVVVSSCVARGAARSIGVGAALETIGLHPGSIPSHRGGHWDVPDGVSVGSDAAWACSLVDAERLVGIVIVVSSAKLVVSALRDLCDALKALDAVGGAPFVPGVQLLALEGQERAHEVSAFLASGASHARVQEGAWVLEMALVVGDEGRAVVVDAHPLRPARWTRFLALSARQRFVAMRAARGDTLKDIAAAMGRSRETVKDHLKSVYRGLGVRSRIEVLRHVDAARLGREPEDPRRSSARLA